MSLTPQKKYLLNYSLFSFSSFLFDFVTHHTDPFSSPPNTEKFALYSLESYKFYKTSRHALKNHRRSTSNTSFYNMYLSSTWSYIQSTKNVHGFKIQYFLRYLKASTRWKLKITNFKQSKQKFNQSLVDDVQHEKGNMKQNSSKAVVHSHLK